MVAGELERVRLGQRAGVLGRTAEASPPHGELSGDHPVDQGVDGQLAGLGQRAFRIACEVGRLGDHQSHRHLLLARFPANELARLLERPPDVGIAAPGTQDAER